MRNSGFLWVIVVIMILLDFYVYQAIKVVTTNSSPVLRTTVTIIYWTISVIALAILILLPYINFSEMNKFVRMYVFALVVGLFFSKLIASIFIGIDDLRRGGTWLITKLFSNPSVEVSQKETGITRSVFLSWLGLGIGSTLLGSFIYGFTNKYNYQVRRVRLAYKNLPDAFRGLKAVHISDIHAGSFSDRAAVEAGVQKILELKPDVIMFTGDLVNDHAEEMDNYRDIFRQLKAPYGVYSTLGNHDYGEYAIPRGLNEEERRAKVLENVEKMKELHASLGWKLLMNEQVSLEKDGQSIGILGIENWSKKGNFPKYGKLEEAYTPAKDQPFKILMSHDPSHWDGEVREKYGDIDLMLAGHTHGMQFGVELPGFKWSPVQYMYQQWAGLYTEGNQKLYVNRGFGFIGYPGRVGILPEITLLEFA